MTRGQSGMLDKNALSQLQSLKQEIQNSIPRFEGKVRASGGRFGFVVTDDNQQFYLSADEMEKVLPGDRVAVRIETNADDKQQAIIEQLISSDLKEFCGSYLIKGKGHFVQPDHPALNRWIFIPPKARLQCKEGDLVRARLTQHPWPEGKAQASIEEQIGTSADNGVEARYMCQKWQIPQAFSEASLQQAAELAQQGLENCLSERVDLTSVPFITIDSATSRDLDDALYAEADADGWLLRVAIADPAALIAPGSALDQEARLRTTSAYFANLVVPMLPAEVSEQLASLLPGQDRPALVADIRVSTAGEATLQTLQRARIRSHAKLSYSQVAEFLANPAEGEIAAELQTMLATLGACASQLGQYRRQHFLAMDERPDYRLMLDENGKVREILRVDRNDAQKLVEECMLVCNRLSADFMASRGAGIYIEHAGVRSERLGDVMSLLRDELQMHSRPKLRTVEEYREAIRMAENANSQLPLRDIITRQLERSYLTTTANPHFGLGFEHYTTMTSPLRKYNDLLAHRLLNRLLANEEAQVPTEQELDAIQDQQSRVRAAANQADSWMKLGWFAQQDRKAIWPALITQANANSITVRIDAFGIDGQIDRRKAGNGWVFDSKTLSHRNGEQVLGIGQSVNVRIQDIQPIARELRFQLAE